MFRALLNKFRKSDKRFFAKRLPMGDFAYEQDQRTREDRRSSVNPNFSGYSRRIEVADRRTGK